MATCTDAGASALPPSGATLSVVMHPAHLTGSDIVYACYLYMALALMILAAAYGLFFVSVKDEDGPCNQEMVRGAVNISDIEHVRRIILVCRFAAPITAGSRWWCITAEGVCMCMSIVLTLLALWIMGYCVITLIWWMSPRGRFVVFVVIGGFAAVAELMLEYNIVIFK